MEALGTTADAGWIHYMFAIIIDAGCRQVPKYAFLHLSVVEQHRTQ